MVEMLKPHHLLMLVYGLICLWASPVVAGEAVLSWTAVDDPTVLGYNVYYGTASHTYGEPVNVGNHTTHTVRGLAPGTYYFAVTAYNSVGESGFSNEASKVISATADGISHR